MSKLAFVLHVVDKLEKQIWRTQTKVHHVKIQLFLVFTRKSKKLKASCHYLLSRAIFLASATTFNQQSCEYFANVTG